MIKPIILTPIIVVISLIGAQTAMAQTVSQWDLGASWGRSLADADFKNGAGMHEKCDDHQLGDQSTDFCLGFKAAYIIEWGVMTAAH